MKRENWYLGLISEFKGGGNKIGSLLGVFYMLCWVNRNYLSIENLNYSENPFIIEVSNETKQFFSMKIGNLCQNLGETNVK